MDGVSFALIELILVFGGVLAFGAWQLWDLKRYDKNDGNKGDDGKGGAV